MPIASFVAVNDLPTILQNENSFADKSIIDGIDNTLLLAQIRTPNVPWTKPVSLKFREFSELCGSGIEPQNGTDKPVGYPGQLLLFADLEIYRIIRPIPASTFQALWTKDGQESVSRESLIRANYIERRN